MSSSESMVATDKTQTPADVTSPVSYSLKGWKLCFRLRQIQRPGKIKGASWLADSGTSNPELVSPSLSPQSNTEPHDQSCGWQGPSAMEKGVYEECQEDDNRTKGQGEVTCPQN